MTEIPEHLLKRSKAAKTGKSSDEEPDTSAETPKATGSAVTPAASAAPTVPAADIPNLDSEPEPEPPAPGFMKAAKARKKAPVWALPVIAFLPIWAYMYPGTMQEPETEDVVAIEGEILYGTCSGCHGGGGGGGTGYKFSDGEVLQTFNEPIDMMVHIARGSQEIDGQEYGNVRDDGTRRKAGELGAMPAQLGQMSMIELEIVVYHERHLLAGEEAETPEYEEWFEHMTETWEAEGSSAPKIGEEDLELLLACADPDVTPEATGEGAPEGKECPGPKASSEETEES